MAKLNYTYNVVRNDETTNVTVFVPGEAPYVADNTHPNFDKIISIIHADMTGSVEEDVDFLSLFDIAAGVAKRFRHLSERISVKDGKVFFDLEEVDNSLTQQIVRFMNDEVEDWRPLVAFFENVADNPVPHSREQLYDWLKSHKVTITDNGMIVGYKGVKFNSRNTIPEELEIDLSAENGGQVGWSTYAGEAFVDGVKVTGYIPYPVGAIVEMPRGEVVHNPREACSHGLHVGTFGYAKSYSSGGKMLEVHVNPRDVVSVPSDAGGEKVRVCRLYVADDTIEQQRTTAVTPSVPKPVKPKADPTPGEGTPAKSDFVKASDKDVKNLTDFAKKRKRGFQRVATAQGWELRPHEGTDEWFRPVQWRLPLTAK